MKFTDKTTTIVAKNWNDNDILGLTRLNLVLLISLIYTCIFTLPENYSNTYPVEYDELYL